MHLVLVDLQNIFISPHNVRKTLDSKNEEDTTITDLANDIHVNGLLNPLTVRKSRSGMYEVIAGQRRFLAFKNLTAFYSTYKNVPCNVIDVDDQKAEELSLVENIQRNQMNIADKISAYSRLYDVYCKDLTKAASMINVSKWTLKKYILIRNLPEEIIQKMDSGNDDKISMDVAVELTKIPSNVDVLKLCEYIQELTSRQKVNAIKEFIRERKSFADDIVDIAQNIAIQSNNIKLVPSEPYVYDENIDDYLVIPECLYQDVVKLIRSCEQK